MKKQVKNTALAITLGFIAITSAGCQAQKNVAAPLHHFEVEENISAIADCSLTEKSSLSRAVIEAKTDLTNEQCHPSFDRYFDNLLTIAAGNPSPAYKKDFSDFLVWTANQGILTMQQAKEFYSSYFSLTFTSLPDEYNVCSQCSDKTKNAIEENLCLELEHKKQGMSDSCGDKTSYYEARSQHENVLLFLDATCSACNENS
jgi:hypothetical protein